MIIVIIFINIKGLNKNKIIINIMYMLKEIFILLEVFFNKKSL